jgi:hypothetical protein
MQQQELENNHKPVEPSSSTLKAPEPDQHQQNQLNFIQKLRAAIPLAIQSTKVLHRATRQDPTALQVEDALIHNFEQLGIAEQLIQSFKSQLEKLRQRPDHLYLEDIYVMGGTLIYYCILFPLLMGLGMPDPATRLAWVIFAISFPCAAGFFLLRFLKEKNMIPGYGRFHSVLAFLAITGAVAITASLLFHIWNITGYLFLACSLVIFLGYLRSLWNIYYGPLLSILKTMVKTSKPAPTHTSIPPANSGPTPDTSTAPTTTAPPN